MIRMNTETFTQTFLI